MAQPRLLRLAEAAASAAGSRLCISLWSLTLRGVFAFSVTGIFIFLFLPILFVVWSSFSESTLLSFPPGRLTTRWYTEIPGEFWKSLRVSFIVALCSGLAAILLGTPAALALMRGAVPGRRVIESLLLSPLALPALVLGVSIYQYYVMLWEVIGFSLTDRMSGLLIGHTSFTMPYVVRTVMASMARMDRSLEEAALNLGSTPMQTFFRIMVPIITPGIIAGGMFAFIVSFDDVPVSLFLASADATPLPIKIFTSIEFSISPVVTAISAISIYVSVVLIFIVEKMVGLNELLGAQRGAGA